MTKPKSDRKIRRTLVGKYDDVQTPPEALDYILPLLLRSGIRRMWEPAAGEGLLVGHLELHGFQVSGTDIKTGQDFFTHAMSRWDCIVTNPPYSIKYRWLERCVEYRKPFCLLLPVEALGTKKLMELVREAIGPWQAIMPRRRINFKMPRVGWKGGGSWFPTFWLTCGLEEIPHDVGLVYP